MAIAPSLHNLRGIHLFTPTNAADLRAMREAVPGPLQSGRPIVAASISARAHYSPFTSGGTTLEYELTEFDFTNVTLRNGNVLPRAGFWLIRDRSNGKLLVQFRPTVDADLAAVEGFPGDVFFTLDAAGVFDPGNVEQASGDAMQLVADVIGTGAGMIRGTQLTVESGSTMTAAILSDALERIRVTVLSRPDQFFDQLIAQLNVNWIAVGVDMFVETVSDPTVRLRYRPASGERDNEYATVDDDVLRAFIVRARQKGLGVYLALFLDEPGGDQSSIIPESDPRCRTPQAPIHRSIMGNPELNPGDFASRCLSARDFWWAPSHPLYEANKAKFWRSYTDIAVKYAQLAQETGVGMYGLGTETEYLFRQAPTARLPAHFGAELRQMVQEVRQVYAGKLTYDQLLKIHLHPDWFGGGEWASSLHRDIGLDAIGLSGYADIYAAPPTDLRPLAEIEEAFWVPVFEQALVPLRARNPGLPILFTEIGVVDDVGVLANQASNLGHLVTGRDAQGISDGMRQQGRVYEAFFNVNERYGALVTGAFFWSRNIFPLDYSLEGYCATIGHHIQCSEPAMAALRTGYEAWKLRDVDRVLNWAQAAYPQLLTSAESSTTLGAYRLRYYPGSQTYVGYADGRFLVHNGKAFNFTDVGGLDDLLAQAAAAGY
jgi:hypothetical protein